LHTVHFETRTQNKSSTAMDNLFVHNSRLRSSYTSPLINGLSDHDAQFLTIHNICKSKNKIPNMQRTRQINNDTLTTFQTLLEQEKWESVCQKQDTNCMYNSFLSSFLIIFGASFPVIYVQLCKHETGRLDHT
jgi:hypothetical protein